MRSAARLTSLVLATAALGLVLYDRCSSIRWVGSTNLTVQFVVTNEETGRPVEGVEILAYSEGGYPKESPLRWQTGPDGVARGEVSTLCSGAESGLGFTNTYHVRNPTWLLVVTAHGHQSPDLSYLNEPGGRFRGTAVRTGPGQSELVVLILLRRVPA